MIELRYYIYREEKEFCRHCLHVLTRRTQKTLAQCPNCGEAFSEK